MRVTALTKLFGVFRSRPRSELEQWAAYINRWILRGECPVCHHELDSHHRVSHIASCNFNGPNPENGFLGEVKARDWEAIIKPFDRLTSMDLMACEAVSCPRGFAIVVWVEVDQGGGGAQYPIYTERIEETVLDALREHVDPVWQEF